MDILVFVISVTITTTIVLAINITDDLYKLRREERKAARLRHPAGKGKK